jgi:hypothetical protein
MRTKNLYQRPWWHHFFSPIFVLVTLFFFSCEKKIEQDFGKPDDKLSSARSSQQPLFHISYEVETFTVSYLNTTAKIESDHPLIFKKIAAQPRLERKSLDFRYIPTVVIK